LRKCGKYSLSSLLVNFWTDGQTVVTFLHKSPYSMPWLHKSLSALLKVVMH
jgi:hypothetical protein